MGFVQVENWPSLFFWHKLIKKEQGQYQATLTEHAWSIKDLLYDLRGNCSCGVVPSEGDQSQHRI